MLKLGERDERGRDKMADTRTTEAEMFELAYNNWRYRIIKDSPFTVAPPDTRIRDEPGCLAGFVGGLSFIAGRGYVFTHVWINDGEPRAEKLGEDCDENCIPHAVNRLEITGCPFSNPGCTCYMRDN